MTIQELRLMQIQKDEQAASESKIQHCCVSWFRHEFPNIDRLLFSVPNGGLRGPRAGAIMMYEGQVRGVSDLILLYPSKGKASLCIEMKVPKRKGRSAGIQNPEQKTWQALVEQYGSKYVVCRGLLEFVTEVCDYLGMDVESHIEKAIINYHYYR